jgi:hypothetical protein
MRLKRNEKRGDNSGSKGSRRNKSRQQADRAKAELSEVVEPAIALRSKFVEFHGLEREFIYFQSRMLSDFEESGDIKHPRDIGDAR